MQRIILGALFGAMLTLLSLWVLGRLDFRQPAALSGRDAAEFRLAAKEAIESTRPMCALSSRADNDEIKAAARKSLSTFRAKLSRTYAEQFDIAEEDVSYIQSITQVECFEPDRTTHPAKLSRIALAETAKHVQHLQELVKG